MISTPVHLHSKAAGSTFWADSLQVERSPEVAQRSVALCCFTTHPGAQACLRRHLYTMPAIRQRCLTEQVNPIKFE